MGKTGKIATILPFICIAMSLFISKNVSFPPAFSPEEMKVLSFSRQEVIVPEKKESQKVASWLKSPIHLFKRQHKKEPERVELSSVSSPVMHAYIPREVHLSFILVNEKKKMAIINGNMVEEGESIDGMRVEKITKERVLLNDKGGRWIEIE